MENSGTFSKRVTINCNAFSLDSCDLLAHWLDYLHHYSVYSHPCSSFVESVTHSLFLALVLMTVWFCNRPAQNPQWFDLQL